MAKHDRYLFEYLHEDAWESVLPFWRYLPGYEETSKWKAWRLKRTISKRMQCKIRTIRITML